MASYGKDDEIYGFGKIFGNKIPIRVINVILLTDLINSSKVGIRYKFYDIKSTNIPIMRSNDNQAFVNRNESLSDPFLGNRENSRQSSSRLDRTSTLSNNYLVRRLTSVYENLPNRDEVINEMIKVSNAKGPDGDVPLPGGFASELRYSNSLFFLSMIINTNHFYFYYRRFWKLALISVILGCLMGLLGCFYLNLTDQVPKYWTNNDEFSNPDDLQPYSGQMFWVGVTAGAGLIVGLCRWLSSFPDSNDGLFKEINNYHVDHKFSIQTYFLSIISLSGGAALGPEAALVSYTNNF